MKKKITTFTLLIFSIIAFSQDMINYNNGQAYCYFLNEDGDIVKEINMGKEVSIKYDTFFKSYSIMLIVEDGIMNFEFKFLEKLNDGRLLYLDKSKHNSGIQEYYLSDELESKNSLTVIKKNKMMNSGQDLFVAYIFKNLIETKY